MPVAAEDHHHHHHGHDHGGHAHATPSARSAQVPNLSLLRTSAARRLAGVLAALILVWAAVAWALA